MLKLCIVGEGAFGKKHLESLLTIDDITVSWLVGADAKTTEALAKTFDIPNWTCDLKTALLCEELNAVILATPTPIHAFQAKQVMFAGKHVLVEIPMADNLKDAQELVRLQKATGVIAMVGHLRRFNLSHQWLHNKIKKGELKIQQMLAQTYFFRRDNINALGEPRSWTDHLLWHHACHTVDLFAYQTGQQVEQCFALQGPTDPALGIAMDMTIGMKVPNGAICTLSLSFNNEGPLGSVFRYICDKGTFVAKNDELFDGEGKRVDLSGVSADSSGIELIQREFIKAVRSGEEPNASFAQCLGAMKTLDRIEQTLDQAL
jgi:2-hydroxy-4-carboxymuconate semialdehyde hemiacetal dehydrogenase